jgi:hypothetical protein
VCVKVVQVFSLKKMAKELSRHHPDMGPDYWAGLFIHGRIIRPPQDFSKTAKDLAWRHPGMGPNYLARLFIPGRIIRPPLKFSAKRLRTCLGVTQTWGWIIWPDISSMAG